MSVFVSKLWLFKRVWFKGCVCLQGAFYRVCSKGCALKGAVYLVQTAVTPYHFQRLISVKGNVTIDACDCIGDRW